jgi:hypothetical protein
MISTVTLSFDLTYRNPSTGALEPRGIVTDSTDYAGLGIDLLTSEAKGLGVITFNGDVIVDLNDPNDPDLVMIDLENWGTQNPGQTPVYAFSLELDLNGNVANGVYTFEYNLRLKNSIAFLSITLPNTALTDGFPYRNFFEAGNELTMVPSGDDVTIVSVGPEIPVPGSGEYTLTLSGLQNDVDGDATFDITNLQLSGVYTYSGCTQTTADVSFTYDCEVGDSGSWAVANTTVLKSNEVISSLNCTISYPSWTALTPTFDPRVVVTSLPYPSAPNTETPLATGTYTVSLTEQILQTQTDGLILQYSASTTQEFVVSCAGSLCGLTPCIENLRVAHANELQRNRISKYQVFVDNVLLYYAEAQNYRACGDTANYRATIELIKQNLDSSGCECACCDDNTYYWVSNNSGVSVIDSLVQSFQFRLYDGIPADDQDVTQGVQIGALWQDFNTGIIYRCTDNEAGAAVWEEFFGPGVVAAADVTAVPSANFLTANNVQGQLDEVEALAVFDGINGLNKVGNDVRLGGVLDASTTINCTNGVLKLVGGALTLDIEALSGGPASRMTVEQTSTSAVASNLLIETTVTGGAGANGIGASIWLRAQDALGAIATAGKIISTWVDAAIGNSNVQLTTKLGGTESVGFTLNPNSSITLNEYGAGTFTGAAEYGLSVDALGNIIEVPPVATYVGRTRLSGGAILLDEYANTTGATISISNTGVGVYTITASSGVFATNTVAFVQLQGAAGVGFATTAVPTSSTVVIRTFNVSGVADDAVINTGSYIKIESYV